MNKMDLTISINGVSYLVEVEKTGGTVGASFPAAATTAVAAPAVTAAPVVAAAPKKAAPVQVAAAAGDTTIPAPMPGKVSKVNVKVGDNVKKGDVLMLLEAMKMQNEIASPVNGIIKSVNANSDDNVKPGQVLLIIGN